jgi:hypothetical protein
MQFPSFEPLVPTTIAEAIAALCIASAMTGCVAPLNVGALEKLKLEGEPYYVEHRRHECGGHIGGFVCVSDCRSTLWNVWRTSGSPEQKLEALDREMMRLGFERDRGDRAKETEKDHWVLLYTHPRGGGALVLAGDASPDGMMFKSWPLPRRDRTNLEGEYVYGVQTSYQSPWDRLTEGWKNATWPFSDCSEQEVGVPHPRSQRR